MLRAGVVAVVLVLVMAAPAAAQDRYSFAGGCYAVGGLAGAEQVRMQATALGRYLLYRPDGTYVTPDGRLGHAGRLGADAGPAGAHHPGDRLRGVPRSAAQRHRHADQGRDRRSAASAARSTATCTG